MNARLYLNQLKIGSVARDFIKFVKGACPNPVKETKESKTTDATEILESFQEHNKDPNEIDLGLMDGKFLNRRLDHELTQFKVIPHFLTNAARANGEGVFEGSLVSLLGDDRMFRLVRVLYEQEAIRIEDQNHNELVVPWGLIRPLPEEE